MTTFLRELSEQESVMLLNLWLIALAAKDASLIVSLQCTNQNPQRYPNQVERGTWRPEPDRGPLARGAGLPREHLPRECELHGGPR